MVIADLRATIYQHLAADYQADHILRMNGHDANGYVKISGITMIAIFVCSAVLLILTQVAAAMILFAVLVSSVTFINFLLLMSCLPIAIVCALISLKIEEHTSELQSRQYLVCRLLLEKKK